MIKDGREESILITGELTEAWATVCVPTLEDLARAVDELEDSTISEFLGILATLTREKATAGPGPRPNLLGAVRSLESAGYYFDPDPDSERGW